MTGIRLGTNIDSLAAQSELNSATSQLSQSYQRLSSGLRINQASDDAAGLAIATQLDAKTKVFTQAIRNVNDGVSVANLAEGALNSLKTISQRQLELAEEAANGTISLTQRQALNTEANALVNEYNRIVGSTSFNGMSLFDPSLGTVLIQAGYGQAGSLQLSLSGQLQRPVGDGTFSSTATASVGGSPTGYAVADFNGDGNLDYVSANWSGANATVFLGNGNGTFGAATVLSTGSFDNSVAVGDFNGDGKMDFVVVASGGNTDDVFLGNGNGTFQAAKTITVDTGIDIRVATGDFNGDGKTDFVTVNSTNGNADVSLSNGDGTFATTLLPSGVDAFDVTVGDFNGDGKLDFSIANYTGANTVETFLGNGNGTFQSAITTFGIATPGSITAADLNGDGKLDLIVGSTSGALNVLFGNNNGTFAAPVSIAPLSTYTFVQTGDFNSDGITDIAYLSNGTSINHIALGNGDGTFQSAKTFAEGVGVSPAFAVGDFNNDGRSDIVGQGTASSNAVYSGGGSYSSTAQYLNINTQQGALAALNTVNGNLNRIEGQLGVIGATTSRFQFELANLQSLTENYQAAESRIMDVDVAQETANLVRTQILQQAAAAILAQANQSPEIVLKLLT